jgi:hypothetical protein
MDEQFSIEESIATIEKSISQTKNNIYINRFYYLFWGWLLLLAILGQYVLISFTGTKHHYAVWLLMPIGVVITALRAKVVTQSNRPLVSSFTSYSIKHLWISLTISFFLLVIVLSIIGWVYSWTFFLLLYGIGIFTSGRILKFTPMIVGGMVNWFFSCIVYFFTPDNQLLIAAISIVAGFLIPAYMLTVKHKNL